jgi:hypothetical protein
MIDLMIESRIRVCSCIAYAANVADSGEPDVATLTPSSAPTVLYSVVLISGAHQ